MYVLRYDDQISMTSSEVTDIRDDPFMGYDEQSLKTNSIKFYDMEEDEAEIEIDQVVPTQCDDKSTINIKQDDNIIIVLCVD